METLYRKVKCSERLPDYGTYIAKFKGGDNGCADVIKTTRTNNHWSDDKWHNDIEWWLEELQPQEQVTVEEIEEIILDAIIFNPLGLEIDEVETKEAAQAIHSLVYGEKGGKG